MTTLSRITATAPSVAITVVRVALGAIFFAHGAQKVLGWWGGPGFSATIESFESSAGIPVPFALCAMAAEFLGGLGLIVGCLSRIAAAGTLVTMLVAMFKVHWAGGFFLPAGFEYTLALAAMSLAILIAGGGALSIDRALASRRG